MKQRPQRESTQPNDKLLGLELVRFISSLSVLVWHYKHFSFIGDEPINLVKEQLPFYSFISLFYDYGFCGVEIFWCLSGFIFFWKYRDAISSNTISYQIFLALRFSRLYPLHFATLIIVLILQTIYFSQTKRYFVFQANDISHFLLQLVLASNWGFETGYSFNGPIWSVSIEVLAYGVFFVVLHKISKSFLVNIVAISACVLMRYFGVYSFVFICLAFFYIGGLSAIAFKTIQHTEHERLVRFILLFALLASPYVIATTRMYQHKDFLMFFLMSHTPVLLFVSAHNFNLSLPVQKAFQVAGNMTYSSYLIQFPLQLLIVLYFFETEQNVPFYSTSFFLGFIFVTLTLAYYIHKFFEIPAQNFLRKKIFASLDGIHHSQRLKQN